MLDSQAIADVIYQYAHSIDRRDWALHRACFTDEIEMDFSASIGGAGLTRFRADEWVALVRPFFTHLPATQHIATSAAPVFDGPDRATCISILHAQHYLPKAKGDPVQRMIGHYENGVVRTAGGWRIARMVQTIAWNEGNWQVFELAASKAG